ncbi:MAG TPA: ABC transporter transmembrane domain-containing protein, partial [Aggregatilineaceae bacterium]|nr:ABC transporter transmembrane domain-containing protein [Aggregatilineaceae bacterium]
MNIDKRLIHETPRGALALTVRAGIAAGALLIGQAYLLSQIVRRAFLDGHSLTQVSGLLGALVGISVARAGLLWVGEVAANRTAGEVKSRMRERLFRHLTALGPVFVRGERTGELVNTAVKGIEELDAYFSQYLPQLALAVLIPLAMLLFVFPIDPLSGVVLLVTAPLIPFFMMLIGSLASALSRRQWTTLSRMSAHFLDVLQGLTTLKLLGRSRDQIQTITRISDRFRETTMGVLRVAFLSALVLEMLATISTAVIAVEIGLRLLYDKLPFDEAFFVLILAPEFYLPLRLLGTRFHAGIAGATAAARIFEVLEQAPRVTSTANDWTPTVQTIRFENVRAAYEDRAALNGVSFEMQPGQKV